MYRYPLLVFLLILSSYIYAQKKNISSSEREKNKKDIKVGVVLGGGGAKGLAHIAVLKELEDIGIRIDYIGGTSMGAIVGGLYAVGYSANQIDSIFKVTDFSKLLQWKLPRKNESFFKKKVRDVYTFSLGFNKLKIRPPSFLVNPQEYYNELNRILLPVLDSVSDFSKLPIPFYCIAVDLETGKNIELSEGYLPKAIYASSSLPTLFPPVTIDNHLLSDGGVVNNIPTKEMKAKDVDYIIGVNVQRKLNKRKDIKTIIDVLTQTITFRLQEQLEDSKKYMDILVDIDLKDIGLLDFAKQEEILSLGKEAIIKHREQLEEIKKLQHPSPISNDNKRKKIQVSDTLNISEVIKIDNQKTNKYIDKLLGFKRNETIEYEDLKKGINNLLALDEYDHFFYELHSSKKQPKSKILSIKFDKNQTNTFLNIGLHYNRLYNTAVLFNFTTNNILFKRDMLSADLIVGNSPRYNIDYHLNKNKLWSVIFSSKLYNYKAGVPITNNIDINNIPNLVKGKIYLRQVELKTYGIENQILLRSYFKNFTYLSMGLQHKYVLINTDNLNQILSSENEYTYQNVNLFSTFFELKVDTLDDLYFPTKGMFFNAKIHHFFKAKNNVIPATDYINEHSMIDLKYNLVTNFFKRFTIDTTLEGGFTIDPPKSNPTPYLLGGYGDFFPNNIVEFYGYDYLSVDTNNYIKAKLLLDYRLFKNHHLSTGINIALVGEISNQFNSNNISGNLHKGGIIGYGFNSFLGPIEIKYLQSFNTNNQGVFFSIGFPF